MKNFILTSTFALCAFGMEANAQNATIDLKIKGLEDGAKLTITLAGTYEQEAPLQTVELKKGKAQFAFPAEGPRGYRISVADTYGNTIVALDKDEHATLTATIKQEVGKSDKPLVEFESVTVKGSPTHDRYVAQRPDRDAMNKAYEKYHADNKEILDKLDAAGGRDTEAYKALTQTPEYQKFAKDEHDFFNLVSTTISTAITNNSDNWMGPFFMTTNYSYLTTEQFPVYEQFAPEVKESFYGKVVAERVVPMSTEAPMPNFEFTDHATGEKLNLYDICRKNRYVLLDFWASWCGPCRKEIPNFKAQYELYKDKGFQIVSISADQRERDWLKALEEEQTPWPNDIDGDKGIAKLYKVQFYPTVYLLDKDARVIVSNNDARGEKLRTKLAELFQ